MSGVLLSADSGPKALARLPLSRSHTETAFLWFENNNLTNWRNWRSAQSFSISPLLPLSFFSFILCYYWVRVRVEKYIEGRDVKRCVGEFALGKDKDKRKWKEVISGKNKRSGAKELTEVGQAQAHESHSNTSKSRGEVASRNRNGVSISS